MVAEVPVVSDAVHGARHRLGCELELGRRRGRDRGGCRALPAGGEAGSVRLRWRVGSRMSLISQLSSAVSITTPGRTGTGCRSSLVEGGLAGVQGPGLGRPSRPRGPRPPRRSPGTGSGRRRTECRRPGRFRCSRPRRAAPARHCRTRGIPWTRNGLPGFKPIHKEAFRDCTNRCLSTDSGPAAIPNSLSHGVWKGVSGSLMQGRGRDRPDPAAPFPVRSGPRYGWACGTGRWFLTARQVDDREPDKDWAPASAVRDGGREPVVTATAAGAVGPAQDCGRCRWALSSRTCASRAARAARSCTA